MNKKKYILTFIVHVVSSICCCIQSQSFQVDGRVINIEELNQKINKILDETDIPGLSFAVFDEGEVVFYNAYGYKEYEISSNGDAKGKGKIDKNTVFEACSLSKSYLVFAIHKLVDQGILDLDKPLHEYLSHPRLIHDNRYKKITARMVLSHFSGIENWQFYNNPDVLEIISEPGTAFNYSGEGYIYLSKIIEKIIGQDIQSYMKTLVYEPLKLERTFTTFSSDSSKPSNYSVGHNVLRKPFPKIKNTEPEIASMISTTAKDYAKLLIGIFDNKHLSKDRINDLVRTGLKLDKDSFYGPGFQIHHTETYKDTVVYQRGDNDGFKGFGFYSITRNSGYAMFTNGELGDKIQKVLDDITLNHGLFGDVHQYPDPSFEIISIYNEYGYSQALSKFKELIFHPNEEVLSKENIERIIDVFMYNDPKFVEQIAILYHEKKPASLRPLFFLGKAKMEDGRYNEAILEFKNAMKKDSTSNAFFEEMISVCNELIKKNKSRTN